MECLQDGGGLPKECPGTRTVVCDSKGICEIDHRLSNHTVAPTGTNRDIRKVAKDLIARLTVSGQGQVKSKRALRISRTKPSSQMEPVGHERGV